MKDPLTSNPSKKLFAATVTAFIIGLTGIYFADYSPSNFEKRSSAIKSVSADKDLDIILIYVDNFNTLIIPDTTE